MLATVLGLVPLAWCAWRRERRPTYWWMAAAFGVSFLADVAGALGYARYAGQVYPVLQAALVAMTLLAGAPLYAYVAAVLFAASLSIAWRGAGGYDVILRLVAFGGLAGFSLAVPNTRLRASLVVYFGLGALAWLGYVWIPGWTTYALMQGTRAVGIGLWCWAAQEA
jgi:hypothetical protein